MTVCVGVVLYRGRIFHFVNVLGVRTDGIRLAPVCRAACPVRLRNRVPVWVPPVAAGIEGDGEVET